MGREDREVKWVNMTLNLLQQGGKSGRSAIFCLPGHQQCLEEAQVKAELESHVLAGLLIRQGGVV